MTHKCNLIDITKDGGVFIDGDWIESKDQDPKGDVRLIQLADIGDGYFIDKSKRFLTSSKARELRCTYINENDVLVARMPDPIGRACVFPGLKIPCITVVDVCIVRPNQSLVEPKWLMYLINSSEFRRKISKYITGTTRQRISRGNLSKIEFDVPSIESQKLIIRLLDEANTLRQKRKQAIELLDDYLESLFMDMFGEKAKGYSNWNSVELKNLAKQVKNSMRTGPFGSDLLHSEFVNEGVSVIGIDNAVHNKFTWDERRYITKEKYEKLKRYTLYPGDVIVTIMGTVGRSAVIPDDIPSAINTKHLAAISLDITRANPNFISYSIHSNPEIIRQIQSQGKGAIMTGLNLGIIKELIFKLPPIELQNKFSDILVNTEKLKQKMFEQSKELDNQFQAMMQKAFRVD